MQLTKYQKESGWRIVKFGQIAKIVSTRVDPAETDLEVYVGLKHLDSDNLRIMRRGVPSEVKGLQFLVRPGQIIFGRRRAYQRKAAVADFEGICSTDAMVLEAIPKTVNPGYLPFFIQSDMFMEQVIAMSAGSLSPRVKWKMLADQQFPLPPRKRQDKMVKVASKIEEVLAEYDLAIDKACILLEVLAANYIFDETNVGEFVKLSTLVEEVREHYNPNKNSFDYPWVNFEHIDSSSICIGNYGSSLDAGANQLHFKEYDILYGKIRPYLRKIAHANFSGVCSPDITVLRSKKKQHSCALALILKTNYFAQLAMNTVRGSKMPRANWKVLFDQRINKKNLDDINFQKSLENTMQMINNFKLSKKMVLAIRKKFTNNFLEGIS